MRRSRYISTLLMGAAALSVTACGDEPTESTEAKIFPNVAACEREFSKEQCGQAFDQTRQMHAQTAPRFTSQQECEAEMGPGACTVMPLAQPDGTISNFFMPALMGFMMARALQPPAPGYGSWGYGGGYSYRPIYVDRDGYARTGQNRVAQIPGGRSGLAQGGVGRTVQTPATRSGEIGVRQATRGGFGSTSARYSSSSSSGGS